MQTACGRGSLRNAGPGTEKLPAAAQSSEHLCKALPEFLSLGVNGLLSLCIPAVLMGIGKAQHQHAPADGSAKLLVTSADPAAETAHGRHQRLRFPACQVRARRRYRLRAVVSRLVVRIRICTAIHSIQLLSFCLLFEVPVS